VALHLGHRRSVDLDWFTELPLSDPRQWAEKLHGAGIAFTTHSVDEGTLHGSVYDLRVSFLEDRYSLLQPPIFWGDYETELAADEEQRHTHPDAHPESHDVHGGDAEMATQ